MNDAELIAAWHSDASRGEVAAELGESEYHVTQAWCRLQISGLLPVEVRRRQRGKVEKPERLDQMYASGDGRPSCCDDNGFDPLLDKLRQERGTW
jgi:hypothetical protein